MAIQNDKRLAPHETLGVNELLRSEITGYKKLQVSMTMVQDDELKQYMKDTLTSKKNSIEQIQQFISSSGVLQ